MQLTSDNRSSTRLSCRMAVSERALSATLGEVQNISLDGLFVTTDRLLPEGSILPIVFTLGSSGPEIRPDAEVVHHTPEGMGLRFLRVSSGDTRKLRRYVADLNLIANRWNSSELLRDAAARHTAPITDREKISRLLRDCAAESTFTLIPGSRDLRETTRLEQVSDTGLHFVANGLSELQSDEPVLVLYTYEFVSYSFQAKTTRVSDNKITLTLPDSVHYSERRSSGRSLGSDQAFVVLSLPWRNSEVIRWPVMEMSPGGLSFRAEPKEVYFWPGSQLPEATLQRNGRDEPLTNAVIKHLTTERGADGVEWVRVGIAHGVERAQTNLEHVTTADELQTRGLANRLKYRMANALAKVAFVYHTRFRKNEKVRKDISSDIVRFNNTSGQTVVGVLNHNYENKQTTRAPLVIMTPGFASRKESFSGLAMVLLHNFRQQDRELAVLRIDGTNNLGESYKAPGCEAEGRHTMKYSVSGVIADLLGAIKWAKNNPHIDPTDIIVISASLSSLGVRRALTLPEAADVTRWISLMGPPEGVQSVANAMGNSDPYNNYLKGISNGVVTLFGCLVDADHVCCDMAELQLATLAESRADMAKIKADVTWIVGKHDAFIDPERVSDVMSVTAQGKREILAVNAGHLPRTSDQALAQFALIARHVWRHIYKRDLNAAIPSRGWVAAMAESEWQRIRRERPTNERDYWRHYLMGEDGLGYDIWTVTPEYRQLIADQVRLAAPAGKRFLDLGAGTGNIVEQAAKCKPTSIAAVDLVAEALERIKKKVPEDVVVECIAQSIDGTPRVALRRWLAGEIFDIEAVGRRISVRHGHALKAIREKYSPSLHAILRGSQANIEQALKQAGLPLAHAPFVQDFQILARSTRDNADLKPEQRDLLSAAAKESLDAGAGLPFADASFDCVVSSIVLSYLTHPEDTLAEVYRTLSPGGTFVASSMLPDSEGSKIYINTIKYLETAPEEELPKGYTRAQLITALRNFSDNVCNLVRLEEEGIFHFWDRESFAQLFRQIGFENVETELTYGNPAQAVIVRCNKP